MIDVTVISLLLFFPLAVKASASYPVIAQNPLETFVSDLLDAIQAAVHGIVDAFGHVIKRLLWDPVDIMLASIQQLSGWTGIAAPIIVVIVVLVAVGAFLIGINVVKELKEWLED